ncbi:MAG: hypothetical protein FWG45_01810 [Oscillospiraceae bacterium]|nr:hypothetical protein [Oscillospiraceae bacterium]
MKSKLKRGILASFLAFTMVFSLTSCGGDDDTTTDTGGATNTNDTDTTAEETNLNAFPERPTERIDAIDFGVIRFNSEEITIAEGSANNIGSNPPGVGYNVIRIAGFYGNSKAEDFSLPEDPERQHATIVSQNGEFWENISKIEGYFYFESENEEPVPDNVQLFAQAGLVLAVAGWDHGKNWGGNLLTEFDNEDTASEEPGYVFGPECVFKAVWDIDDFKKAYGTAVHATFNPDGEYKFDQKPFDANEGTGSDANYVGGGVNQFGFMLQNPDDDEVMTLTVVWTGVTIYVHDMDLYEKHVQEVEDALGYKPNGLGEVKQA